MTPPAPPLLPASRDPETGHVFCPPRAFAADGTLRACAPAQIAATGTLYSWTRLGRRCFGQVDLAGGPRVQAPLLGNDHRIGASYTLVTEVTEDGKTREGYARDSAPQTGPHDGPRGGADDDPSKGTAHD